MKKLLLASLFAGLAVVAGCSNSTGPTRYRVSGSVTLDGEPIPFGEVIFTPDATKKNSGPQGKAPIKEGKFDTAFDGGLGAGGGPVVARVQGMSGPGGKTLCEFDLKIDLPQSDSTQDLKGPKEGKAKKPNTPDI